MKTMRTSRGAAAIGLTIGLFVLGQLLQPVFHQITSGLFGV